MECKVCGHSDYDYEENKRLNKDNPFINLVGAFFKEGDDYYRTEQRIRLVVCPICKTVLMDD